MNLSAIVLAVAAALAVPASSVQTTAPQPASTEVFATSVSAEEVPELLFIPAVTAAEGTGSEVLLEEIGLDGELGNTCWAHQNGEIAFSGFINDDGSIVYDDATDYSRCASMD